MIKRHGPFSNRLLQRETVSLPSNPALTINNGLIAFWNAEEASGTRVDATGNGNDLLQTSGVVSNAAGIIGNAAAPTGVAGQFLQIPSPHNFHPGIGGFSVSMWVLLNSLAANSEFLSVFTTVGNQREWFVGFQLTTGKYRMDVSHNGVITKTVTSVTPGATGLFRHIAAGLNLLTGLLWIAVNGKIEASIPYTHNQVFSGTAPLVMSGVNTGTADRLNGRFDASGYWNRSLSPAEVQYLYNSGAGRQYPL